MVDVNVEPWISDSSLLTSVKAIFFGHFIFTSLTFHLLIPQSYLYYNLTYIFLLVWSHINKNSYEAVHMAYIVNVISIPLDIISISIYFSNNDLPGDRFGFVMALFNLFFRGFSFFVLRKEMSRRSDEGPASSSSAFGGQYQDIDSGLP